MADFKKAIAKIWRHEGVAFDAQGRVVNSGYVNDADDPGGETNFGITIATACRNGYTKPMSEMSLDDAEAIYRAEFWNVMNGDKVEDQDVAEELFDTAVNCGTEKSAEFLQRALNVLNKKATLYPDVTVDGHAGPQTIDALNAALKSTPRHKVCILRALDSLQAVHYITISERNPRLEKFVPGWLWARVGVKD